MYYDASSIGLGFTLTQNCKIVANDSSKLKDHAMNYPTKDLELQDVVFSLKILRDYLHGVHVDIFIDHKSVNT